MSVGHEPVNLDVGQFKVACASVSVLEAEGELDSVDTTRTSFHRRGVSRNRAASDTKSEYLDGVIYAMGGATARHVQIVNNVAREIGNQVRDKP